MLRQAIIHLASHLSDPAPIPETIKKTVDNFMRKYRDNWSIEKEKFDEDELEALTDIITWPTNYSYIF